MAHLATVISQRALSLHGSIPRSIACSCSSYISTFDQRRFPGWNTSPPHLSLSLSSRIGKIGFRGSELSFGGVSNVHVDICTRNKNSTVTMAGLLFPHPQSAVLDAVQLLLVLAGPVLAYGEANGKNISYSKFASGDGKKAAMVSSKTGMFVFYFPAAVIASVFLAYRVGVLPLASILESIGASGVAAFLEQALVAADDRLLLVAVALAVHFVKRVLEVLFVHRFSGSTSVSDTASISISYASQVFFLLYSQLLSAGSEAPSPDLKWLGVALFLIGITGNAYHHWMLAHLRKDGSKKYVVPRGGLFDLLVCPHYVLEMIDFLGIALISQTLFGCCIASFVSFYLTGRTIQTKQWYMKKVEGFPEDRSILIPGIF